MSCVFACPRAGSATDQSPPILHEYFPPIEEDQHLSFGSGVTGRLGSDNQPAAQVAQEVGPEVANRGHSVYGHSNPDTLDASYRIDRETTRPTSSRYHDPYNPSVLPFKRLFAYDCVTPSLELGVCDKQLSLLVVSGPPQEGEDSFDGDILVDVAPGVPVRIPSVGPGARLRAAEVEPPQRFQVLRDAADSWYFRGSVRQRVRLRVEVSISRAAFGSEFYDASWAQLASAVPALPSAVERDVLSVAEAMGVSRRKRPNQVVRTLIEYFRGFSPSTERPRAGTGLQLYRELALSRKGVCRHRAYAFVLTALGVGIPARFVRNEAHAWVEVFDSKLWHRVDLGGATEQLEVEANPVAVPVHQPPADPYLWPLGGEQSQILSSNSAEDNASAESTSVLLPQPGTRSLALESSMSEKGPSEVTLTVTVGKLRRGEVLGVSGRVVAAGHPCSFVRVDLHLRAQRGKLERLGGVGTDAAGDYRGTFTVPSHLDVGDYKIVASVPGGGRCGPRGAP